MWEVQEYGYEGANLTSIFYKNWRSMGRDEVTLLLYYYVSTFQHKHQQPVGAMRISLQEIENHPDSVF